LPGPNLPRTPPELHPPPQKKKTHTHTHTHPNRKGAPPSSVSPVFLFLMPK